MVVPDADAPGGLESSVRQLTAALRARGCAVELADPLDNLLVRESEALTAAVPDDGANHVIHVHAPDVLEWPRDVLELGRRGVTLVLTLHLPSYPPVTGRWYARARARLRMARAGVWLARHRVVVVAPSPRAAETARRRLGPWLNVGVLTNGVPDLGAAAPPVDDGKGLRVVFVGRLHSHKRPEIFVEAILVARSLGADVTAAVCGTGPMQGELASRIETAGLGDHVQLLGFVDDPTETIRASDLLVLTSTTEALPMVALEAAMVGRGLVARDGLEGVSEFLSDATATVPADATAAEFGAELARLSIDRERVRHLGIAARSAFTRALTVEHAADAAASLYVEALRRGRRRG